MLCTARRNSIALVTVLLATRINSAVQAGPPALLDAIRSGDVQSIRAALRSGADPNSRDETGATALMHAVIYASRECVRLLLDRGADVNAANGYGSTALMWGAGNPTILQLLLNRGAAVNAQASDGTTALLVAARYGNAESMRVLLNRRADPQASSTAREQLLRIAYSNPDPTMLRMLERAGLRLTDVSQLPGPIVSPNVSQPAVIQRFLALGASPHEEATTATVTLPALSYAAGQGAAASVALLLDHGADPNARGSRGLTPLMMAAATDDTAKSAEVLLARHANVDLRDEAGRTALDWALMRGETAVARVLRQAGAMPMAPPLQSTASIAEPRTAREAIERAVAKLQPAGPAFYGRSKCISCHHQSLPAVAVKLAHDRGIPVDERLAPHPTQATLAEWAHDRERYLLAELPSRGGRAAFVGNVTYGLFGLAAEQVASTPVTDAVALRLAALQNYDGSWDAGAALPSGLRPPLTVTPIMQTALAIQGLSVYAPRGRRAEIARRIARARIFLERAAPIDTQGEVFRLLGLRWADASSDVIANQRSRLLALQRADGGWAQSPTMAPDAYATGQALYALHAARMSPMTAAYQNGADYLRRTQLDDGTWFVRSRAVGFQPYFDAGFPHGRDQFISAAATSWAVMALTCTLDAVDGGTRRVGTSSE